MQNKLAKELKDIIAAIKKNFNTPVSITIALRMWKDVAIVSDDTELELVAKEIKKISKK